jgi:hypothetical protein
MIGMFSKSTRYRTQRRDEGAASAVRMIAMFSKSTAIVRSALLNAPRPGIYVFAHCNTSARIVLPRALRGLSA